MLLDDVRGFVFDVDGTLVQRAGREIHLIPGARDVLESVAASGRPYALFTNGSHLAPDTFAGELRAAGLPIEDGCVLTPLCSVQNHLAGFLEKPRVLAFATQPARDYLRGVGIQLVESGDGTKVDAVFVAHTDEIGFDRLEAAARAVIAGARLLVGSYVPAYAGANGPILSRGAMVAAAIAKASGARPVVVGKPSRAAVRELEQRLGVPSRQMAVVGDDLRLDVALGHLGGSQTVLVRSGISASVDLDGIPEPRRPDVAVGSVAEMLAWF